MPNTNGSFSQSSISAVTTLSKPANAVGFVMMALDSNTANVNWSIGSAASTGSGSALEAGRDTGYVPCAADVSACPVSGTQSVAIQWILSS